MQTADASRQAIRNYLEGCLMRLEDPEGLQDIEKTLLAALHECARIRSAQNLCTAAPRLERVDMVLSKFIPRLCPR